MPIVRRTRPLPLHRTVTMYRASQQTRRLHRADHDRFAWWGYVLLLLGMALLVLWVNGEVPLP